MDQETRDDTLFENIALDLGFISEKKLGEAKKFQRDLKIMDMPVLPLRIICLKKKFLTEAQIGRIERAIKSLESENVIPGYQIISKIARGSLGLVYKAFQTTMERTVCLKVLDPHLAEDALLVRKFMNQGKVLASLSHRNICNGYDAGQAGDRFYIAVEYVPGLNVKELLEVHMKLDEAEAIKIIEQIAEALECASSKGTAHRNIKPESIVVMDDGTAKLCDYGLALKDEEISEESPPGNPFYMSPEQAKGFTDIDVRSDIYSLGATFFHMITGRVPYGGDNPFEIMARHITEPAPSPREANSELSEATSDLISRMMAKEADERFQSATELLRAIRDVKINRLMEKHPPVESDKPEEEELEEDPEPDKGPVVRRRRRGIRPRTRKRAARRGAIRDAMQKDLVGPEDVSEPGKAPVNSVKTEGKATSAPQVRPRPTRPTADGIRRGARPVYAEEPEPLAPAKSRKGLITALVVVLLLGIGVVVLSLSLEPKELSEPFDTSTETSTSRSTGASTQIASTTGTATGAARKPVVWDWQPELDKIKKFAEANPDDAKKVLKRCDEFMRKAEEKNETEADNDALVFKKKYVLSRWDYYSGRAQVFSKKNNLREALKTYEEFLGIFGKFPEFKKSADAAVNSLKRTSALKWHTIKLDVVILAGENKYSEAMKKLDQVEKELLGPEVSAARDARDQIKDAYDEQRKALSRAAEEEFLALSSKVRERLAKFEIEPAKQEIHQAMTKSDLPLFKSLAEDLLGDIDRIIAARDAAETGIRRSIGFRETFFLPSGEFKAGKVISYDKDKRAIKIHTGKQVETMFLNQLSGHTILGLVHKTVDKEDPEGYLNVGLFMLYVVRDQKYATEMFEKASEKGAEDVSRYRRLVGEFAFEDMIEKGNDLFIRGRFLEAVEEFSKVLNAIKNNAGMEDRRKMIQDWINVALEKSGISKLLNGRVDYREGRYNISYDFSADLQIFDFTEYVWSEKKEGELPWSVKSGKMAATGKKLMRWRGSFDQDTNFSVEFDARVLDPEAGFEILVAADGRGYKGKCYLAGFGASFEPGLPREIYFGKLRSKKLTKLDAKGAPAIESGRNYHVIISYTDGLYRIDVDGKKVLEIAEKSYTGGTVVFRAVNGRVQFDNILFVGKLDPDWVKKSG